MAMTLLTDNDNEIKKMTVKVLNRLSGSAPSIVILDAIHESYRKICEETEAWILNTVQTVSAENCLYDATGEYEINIRRVISVKLPKKASALLPIFAFMRNRKTNATNSIAASICIKTRPHLSKT